MPECRSLDDEAHAAMRFTLAPRIAGDLVFQPGNKEVLRITSDGDLVFADATEAALALKREWDRMMGR